jgi:hypothetical protein
MAGRPRHAAARAALALAGHIAECASADEWEDLARLAVTVLSRIDRSPISQHFAARAPVAQTEQHAQAVSETPIVSDAARSACAASARYSP